MADIMEHDLPRYRNWSPTQFDCKGLGVEDRQDWYVAPIGHNRDSNTLTESNWQTFDRLLSEVDPDGNDHECHSFSHWGPGWFEIVLVRPGSECERIAAECAATLECYPILDDEHHSNLQAEAEAEHWESWGRYDFRKALIESAFSEWYRERIEDWSDARIDRLYSAACARENLYSEDYGDGPSFPIADAIRVITLPGDWRRWHVEG
jgi:hypothetical protein